MILGDKTEDAFRQSMLMSKGSMGVFFSNALVGTITTLAIILLLWPLVSRALKTVRKPPASDRNPAR
jgi:putative tricarboxylic transport membrane protein